MTISTCTSSAQDIFLGSVKRKSVEEDDSEEEDEGSLMSRPRAMRRIVSEDEPDVSPHLSLSEPVITPMIIPMMMFLLLILMSQ